MAKSLYGYLSAALKCIFSHVLGAQARMMGFLSLLSSMGPRSRLIHHQHHQLPRDRFHHCIRWSSRRQKLSVVLTELLAAPRRKNIPPDRPSLPLPPHSMVNITITNNIAITITTSITTIITTATNLTTTKERKSPQCINNHDHQPGRHTGCIFQKPSSPRQTLLLCPRYNDYLDITF